MQAAAQRSGVGHSFGDHFAGVPTLADVLCARAASDLKLAANLSCKNDSSPNFPIREGNISDGQHPGEATIIFFGTSKLLERHFSKTQRTSRSFDLIDKRLLRLPEILREKYVGMDGSRCAAQLREADAVINLCGASNPRTEHIATECLVYLETDPGSLQTKLDRRNPETVAYAAAHKLFFTYGYNIGEPDWRQPESSGTARGLLCSWTDGMKALGRNRRALLPRSVHGTTRATMSKSARTSSSGPST
jgi:hypothetical protein